MLRHPCDIALANFKSVAADGRRGRQGRVITLKHLGDHQNAGNCQSRSD
jgi:hypothetical protein